MKRLLPFAALFAVALALPGCPIYADDEDCFAHSECAPGYYCDFQSGECRSTGRASCDAPSDCPETQTCGRAGRCRVGDCTFEDIGCVSGYTCAAPDGVWECVRDDGSGGAGAEAGAGSGSGGESGDGAGGTAGAAAGAGGAT